MLQVRRHNPQLQPLLRVLPLLFTRQLDPHRPRSWFDADDFLHYEGGLGDVVVDERLVAFTVEGSDLEGEGWTAARASLGACSEDS